MACGIDKFVINKDIDNEFIITIKQNGTTLPMEIVTAEYAGDKSTSITPVYTTNAATEEVILQAAVDAVPAVTDITAVAPVAQETKLTIDGTLVDGTDYGLGVTNVDSTENYSSTYTEIYTDTTPDDSDVDTVDSAVSKMKFLQNLAEAITLGSKCTATVLSSTNILIRADIKGKEFTTSLGTLAGVASSIVTVANVEEVVFIPGSDEVAAIPEISTSAVAISYDISNTPEQLTVNDILGVGDAYTFTEVLVTVPKGSVVSATGGVTLNATDIFVDVYTLTDPTDSVIGVVPANTGNQTDSAHLEPFDVRIEATGVTSETPDTFVTTLHKLEDDLVVFTQTADIEDATNGQIKITIPFTDATDLTSSKGNATDRYYLKPTYRMVINCSTVNNGKFIAKIPEVYVE